MPYPNEHSARVKSPSAFQADSFRRKTISPGVSIIVGRLKGQTTTTTQAYRFAKSKFTAAQAKAWLKEHDVEYMSFEAASEGKEADPEDVEQATAEEKEAEKEGEVVYYIPLNAVSFKDVDEYLKSSEVQVRVKELTRIFQSLSENIMWSADIADKPAALRSLVDELDGKLTEAVQAEKGLVGRVVSKVRAALGMDQGMLPVEKQAQTNSFMVWKEGERYRWLAVYSNKYRDEDTPPEILSAEAHKTFVKEVDAGLHPYPELWHYHVPGTRWGQADWLAFDDATGFSLASGYVEPGHEAEANTIIGLKETLAVSHGLDAQERDPEDKTIITRYVSHEISELPVEAAANKLTAFSLVQGAKGMSIPEDKRKHLLRVGLTEGQVAEIEADLEQKATAAQQAGLDFKEAHPKDGEQANATTADTAQPEGQAVEKQPEPSYATKDEVADALVKVVGPITQALAALTDKVEAMSASEEQRIAQKAADTPAASIAALVLKNLSAVGSDAARVTVEDMKLAKDRPAEAAPKTTGIPFIDQMLAPQ